MKKEEQKLELELEDKIQDMNIAMLFVKKEAPRVYDRIKDTWKNLETHIQKQKIKQ